MPLSSVEKFELSAIPFTVALAAVFVPPAGIALEPGELVAGAALLLLLPGFFRDLWLWRKARGLPRSTVARSARCMCVESTAGLTGVLAGIALVGFGPAGSLHLGNIAVVGGIGATLATAFLIKDFVFEWSPWKIHREKDHSQLIFRWRK